MPKFNIEAAVFDYRVCRLGEGTLWHPERAQLFWFDILEKKLLTKISDCEKYWQFDECVSAAGWVDVETLLIASETKLFTFNVDTGVQNTVVELEALNSQTRSNDGRADPWGGFWISTMGKNAEYQQGSIYRYYQGELVKLISSVTIPNSICFSGKDSVAYFSDTDLQLVYKQVLDPETGWPKGAPTVFIDFSVEGANPDGAVVDSDGNLWCALWGKSEIVSVSSDGDLLGRISIPAQQPTCPALGGDNYSRMYVSSAAVGLSASGMVEESEGLIFAYEMPVKGLAEPCVRLESSI